MSSKQRERGRILTPDGLNRLQQAIRAWELEYEVRCTQERIKELTSAVKEGGLDPGTTRKILRAKEGVDPESIRCLFTTFGLQLNETDLAPSSRLQVQANPNFVGREGAIADLNALVNRGAKVIVIQARGGVGKTTLARKYLQQEFGSFLEFPIAKETKDVASIESLIEEKLRQLGEEPGREFFVSLDRLKRKLQNERIGILIDNLEPALDSAGKFIEPHRRYVELLRVLTDPMVQSVTFITSRERLREASITVEHYMLRSLDIEAWKQFFQNRNLATDAPAFAALHNAYGGNAKAMDIIRGAILEDYSGDVAAYWQVNQHDLFIERDLEDLVTQQFDRLQQIDPDAYNLLCRMGCYRYQDVPTVPIEGLLCLLWDVPENRQRRVVKSLQDRSLVEFEDTKYWLHPVIRSEAIVRLKGSQDWDTTNRQVAIFFKQSVVTIKTINDALTAFEAYYHYLAIKDFEQAGDVILGERVCNLPNPERLGRSFYKLGLFQQLNSSVVSIINEINFGYSLAELYGILGISYQMRGQLHKAIASQEKSRNIAIEALQTNSQVFEQEMQLRKRELGSLISIGICKIELWELEGSLSIFENIKSNLGDTSPKTFVTIILSFLYSCLGYRAKSASLIEEIYRRIASRGYLSTGYGLFFLGRTHRNLGELEQSFEIYNRTIAYAENSYYPQVKARAINGIAEVCRDRNEFENALGYHSEALAILEKIEIMIDLAETYYQLGLTYQTMKEIKESDRNFQEAIRLFTEIEAPKQVERVMRSMQTDTGN